MLVAGSAPNTKGSCQNFPLPHLWHGWAIPRSKIQSPLPFSAPLRGAFGVFGP